MLREVCGLALGTALNGLYKPGFLSALSPVKKVCGTANCRLLQRVSQAFWSHGGVPLRKRCREAGRATSKHGARCPGSCPAPPAERGAMWWGRRQLWAFEHHRRVGQWG